MPQRHGGALKRGGGSHAPRPRLASKAEAVRTLQRLIHDPACVARVQAALTDPATDPKAFHAMWCAVWDRVYGRPRESLELSGTVGAVVEHQPMTILLPALDAPPPAPPAPTHVLPYSALPPDPSLAPDVATEEEP